MITRTRIPSLTYENKSNIEEKHLLYETTHSNGQMVAG